MTLNYKVSELLLGQYPNMDQTIYNISLSHIHKSIYAYT